MSPTDAGNRMRLRALVDLFDLSLADVARVAGVSRPLVSRAIHGDPAVNPDIIYRKLEGRLGDLIERRRRAFFQSTPVPLSVVQKAIATATDSIT